MTTATNTIEIRITATADANFRRALKAIKAIPGAKYQAATKTWLVSESYIDRGWLTNVRGLYQEVATFEGVAAQAAPSVARCSMYNAEEGCPLHGEVCR